MSALRKIGNVYATDDLRYYVKREAAGYRLRDRESGAWWHLGRNKAEALVHAEERLALLLGQRTSSSKTTTTPNVALGRKLYTGMGW